MDPDQLSIEVVLKDCPAASENYRRFFGLPEQALFQKGLDDWISNRLSTFSLR
jgi:hypothetical protein